MSIVNVDQANAWDGDEGAHWTEHDDRYNAAARPYHERLIDLATRPRLGRAGASCVARVVRYFATVVAVGAVVPVVVSLGASTTGNHSLPLISTGMKHVRGAGQPP